MSTRDFDPMQDIPTTDEEAMAALRYGKNAFMRKCLVGIFECYRAEGQPTLTAYKQALKAGIGEGQEVPSATD